MANYKGMMVRWLIRRDMDEVMEIEKLSFKYPWKEEEFICSLRERNVIGCVAEVDRKVVGFMLYELHKKELRVLTFAMHPVHRNRGVGSQMVQRLIDKLKQQHRTEITTTIRETNVKAQLFFASKEFICIQSLKHCYHETDEDGLLMRYVMEGQMPQIDYFNRISKYFVERENSAESL